MILTFSWWMGRGLDTSTPRWMFGGGLVMDLNRVPLGWVVEPVSPLMDYRIQETVVLYDPGGVLGAARGFVERVFMSPRRVETRTDGLLATSEMHLSRASAALSRGGPGDRFRLRGSRAGVCGSGVDGYSGGARD